MNHPAEDHLKPWDRQPNEPSKAFAAFVIYRDLGSNRSIDAAYKLVKSRLAKGNRAARYWYQWSSDYKWIERCVAWDNHLGGMIDAVREAAVKDAAMRLEERRKAHANDEVGLASMLIERLREMLSRNIYRRELVTDPATGAETEQFVLSEDWSYAHVAGLMKAASDVARRGLAMNNDQDEENDPTRFAEIFYRTKGQMAMRVPTGVMPDMPVDPSAKPVLNLSQKQLIDAGVGTGGTNGHKNGNGRPKKIRPE